MSRACVKQAEDESADLPDRPISKHPNLVTPEGLAAIERAIDRFNAAYKAAVDKNDKLARLRLRSASFATGPRAGRRQRSSNHQ
jgi:hypothetical protein